MQLVNLEDFHYLEPFMPSLLLFIDDFLMFYNLVSICQ